jgi:hypothetical protein
LEGGICGESLNENRSNYYACACPYGWAGKDCELIDCVTFFTEFNDPCTEPSDACPWACWEQLGIATTRIDICTGRLVTETDDGTFESQYNMKKNFFDAECKLGCKDNMAYNFDLRVTTDDGSCVGADTVAFDIIERPSTPEAEIKFEVTVQDRRSIPSNIGREGLEIFLTHNPLYDERYFGSHQPKLAGSIYTANLINVSGVGNYTFSVTPIAAGLYNISVLFDARPVPVNLGTQETHGAIDLTPLPAPSFTARVSATGGRLSVNFDRDTDMAGAQPGSKSCIGLVENASDGILGVGPICNWNGARELNIVFGQHTSNMVGVSDSDIVSMEPNAVFVAMENSFASASANVMAPQVVPTPVVVLNAPTYVSSTSGTDVSCDPATLDARASYHSGGRPWAEVTWELISIQVCDMECTIEHCDCEETLRHSSDTVLEVAEALANFSNNYELAPTLEFRIPRGSTSDKYTFGLLLKNWLGGQSEVTVGVIKVGVPDDGIVAFKPDIVVSGAMRRKTTSKIGFSIDVEASLSGCYEGDKTVNYRWLASPAIFRSVISSGAIQADLCDRKVSYGTCHTKNLHIAPNALPVGQNVTFTLMAWLSTTPQWVTNATVIVEVAQAPLVADIDKGSRSTSAFNSFQLDARPSYDPDDPDSQLTFEWSCTTAANVSEQCSSTIMALVRSDAYLNFPTATFSPGERLLFTVVVTKGDGRSATQTVAISVMEGEPPPVELFWIGVAAVEQSTTKANADRLFVLQGPRSPKTPLTGCGTGEPSVCAIDLYRWELIAGDILDLDRYASHPKEPGSSELTFLTLQPGSLSAEIYYTFRLHATSLGQTGFADFSVSVNSAPFSGTLVVFSLTKDGVQTPVFNGASIQGGLIFTNLLLETSHWVDDDTPFTYRFQVYEGCTSVTKPEPLCSDTKRSNCHAHVSSMLYAEGAKLSVIAYDSFEAGSPEASVCVNIGGRRRMQAASDTLIEAQSIFAGDMMDAFSTMNDDTYIQLQNAVAVALATSDVGSVAEARVLKSDMMNRFVDVVNRDPLNTHVRISRVLASMARLVVPPSQLSVETQSYMVNVTLYVLSPEVVAGSGSVEQQSLKDAITVLDGVMVATTAARQAGEMPAGQDAVGARALGAVQPVVDVYLADVLCGAPAAGMLEEFGAIEIFVASLCPSHIDDITITFPKTASIRLTSMISALAVVDAYEVYAFTVDPGVKATPLSQIPGQEDSPRYASRNIAIQVTAGGVAQSGFDAEYVLPLLDSVAHSPTDEPVCFSTTTGSESDCIVTNANEGGTTCHCNNTRTEDTSLVVGYKLDAECQTLVDCQSCRAHASCGWCSTCNTCRRGNTAGPFYPAICNVAVDTWTTGASECPAVPSLEMEQIGNATAIEGTDRPIYFKVRLSVKPKSDVTVTFSSEFSRPLQTPAVLNKVQQLVCSKHVDNLACGNENACVWNSSDMPQCKVLTPLLLTLPSSPQFEVAKCSSSDPSDFSFCTSWNTIEDLVIHAIDWDTAGTLVSYIRVTALPDNLVEGHSGSPCLSGDAYGCRAQMHTCFQHFSVPAADGDCAYKDIKTSTPLQVIDRNVPDLQFSGYSSYLRHGQRCTRNESDEIGEIRPNLNVFECASLCVATANCLGFQYGINDGGGNDCRLSNSAAHAPCSDPQSDFFEKFSGDTFNVYEDRGLSVYSVQLSSAPTDVVIVKLDAADTGHLDLATSGITFYPEDWNVPKTVYVTGINNNIDDGLNVSTQIGHSIISDAFGYRDQYESTQLPVFLLNDDEASVSGVLSSLDLAEGAGDIITLQLRLGTKPTQAVHLALSAQYVNNQFSAYEVDAAVAARQLTNMTTACSMAALSDACSQVGFCIWEGDSCQVAATESAKLNQSGHTPGADAQIIFQPNHVEIQPEQWQEFAPIVVQATDDLLTELEQEFIVVVTVTSDDIEYLSATVDINGPIVVSDDDTAVEVSIVNEADLDSTTMNIDEGAVAEYFIALSCEPAFGAVFIQFSSDGILTHRFGMVIGASEWADRSAHAVTLSIATDHTDEGVSYSSVVVHNLDGNADFVSRTVSDVSVTILDDDVSSVSFRCETNPCTFAEGGTHEIFIVLTAMPKLPVAVSIQAKYDQDMINGINASETAKCSGSTDSSACLSLPYCIWRDEHSSQEHIPQDYIYNAPLAAGTNVPDVDDCGHLVLLDACAIMLELGDYTLEDLEKEMDCSKAKFCATQNINPVVSTCVLNATSLASLAAQDASQTVTVRFEPEAWNVEQPVTLTMSNDAITTGDRSINLKYIVVSNDTYYAGVNSLLPGSPYVLVDSDSAVPVIEPFEPSLNSLGGIQAIDLTEGDDTAAFYHISLSSEPLGGVVFVSVKPDPLHDSDLIIAPPILAFNKVNWNTPQEVSVTAVDNDVDDGATARILMRHEFSTGVLGYKDYQPHNDLEVVVANDDHSAAVSVGTSSASLQEAGTMVYGVSLASPPRGTVTVNIVSSDQVFVQTTPTALMFNASTYSTAQSVEIQALPNEIDTGLVGFDMPMPGEAGSFTITHQVSADSDPAYYALNSVLQDVDVTIRDDDTAGIVGIPDQMAIIEGQTMPASLTITLSSQPRSSVTIATDLTRANQQTLQQHPYEDLEISPSITVFTRENWNEPHVIDLVCVDDDSVEDVTMYDLGFIISSEDTMYAAMHQSCAIVISDNDVAHFVTDVESAYVSEFSPAQINLELTSKPVNDTVTVAMSVNSPDGDFTISPATVTFGSADWNVVRPLQISVAGYEWGTDQAQWGARVVYTITTSDVHYRQETLDDLQITVSPREGCDPSTIVENSVQTSGPGLESMQTMAGDVTTFSVEAKDANGIICVNSAELITVEVTSSTGGYAYPSDAPGAAFQWETSTELTGALTISYQVFPYTTYNIFVSVGHGLQQRMLQTHSITNIPRTPPHALAAFSDSLDAVTIQFDGDVYGFTNFGNSCESWLTVAFVEHLGQRTGSKTTATCAWQSANTAVVSLGMDFSLIAGSTLQFAPGTIKTYNSHYHTGGVVVREAANPDIPIAMIRVPERQGSCGSLSFDGEKSLGASTSPLNFEWSITDETKERLRESSMETFGDSFAAFLLQNSNANVHSLEFDALPAATSISAFGVQLDLGLKVTNSHGKSGYSTSTVMLDSEPLPTVVISGPTHHNVKHHVTTRVQPLTFVGVVSLHEDCGSEFAPDQRAMSFNWDLRYSVSRQLVVETQQYRHFALPKYSLDIGLYTLTFTATTVASGRANSASVNIEMVRSDLVASLGSKTRQYHPDEQITLDGTGSMDPDMDECTVDCTVLQYVWQCHVGSEDCGLATPGVQNRRWPIGTGGGLQSGTEYRFSLTVVDAGDSGRSNATTSQFISVVGAADYAVTLAAHYEPAKRLTSSDTLLLDAAASQTVDRWDWSVTTHGNGNINPDWLLSSTLDANMLVFRQQVLKPGQTYTFRARAIVGFDAVGHADINVEVNAAPYDRFNAFAVTPATGVALQTNFNFDAGRHWIDDGDYPLQYAFGSTKNGVHELLTSASAATSATVLLPAGEASEAYRITVTVTVYDIFGSPGMAELSGSDAVMVDKLGDSVDDVATAATTVLKQATDFGDVDLLLQSAGSIGHALLDESGDEAATVRSDVISALHAAKDNFPRDTATIQRVADSIGAVLSSDIGLTAASNALVVVSNIVPQVGEDVQLDRGTATSMIQSTQSAFEAVKPYAEIGHSNTASGRRLQGTDTATATAAIHQVSDIVSQSLKSVLAKDAANVKPFEWQSTDYKVHAEKRTLSNEAVVIATDSQQFDINIFSSPSNQVSVGIMTWLDDPFEHADSTGSIASKVCRLTLSDDLVLTAQNPVRVTSTVRALQTAMQQTERYAAVSWDVAALQWTELDTAVQVSLAQGRRLQDGTATDVTFDLKTPPAAEIAVQILTEFYGSSDQQALAGCSMQEANCATTAAEGLAGSTTAGMFIFVRCPASCQAVSGASAAEGSATTFAASSSICGAVVQSTDQSAGGIFTFTKRSAGRYQVRIATVEQSTRCLDMGNGNCQGGFSICGADCSEKVFSVSVAAIGSGTCPHADGHTQPCKHNDGDCRIVDCVGSWSTCDSSCNQKVYTVRTQPNINGAACPVADAERQQCQPGDGQCPFPRIDCVASWSGCNAACKNIYTITTPQVGEGTACEQPPHMVACEAGVGACPVVDIACVGAWTECVRCGPATKYVQSVTARGKGAPCPWAQGETGTCGPGDGACPKDADVILLPAEDDEFTTWQLVGIGFAILAAVLILLLFVIVLLQQKKTRNVAQRHAEKIDRQLSKQMSAPPAPMPGPPAPMAGRPPPGPNTFDPQRPPPGMIAMPPDPPVAPAAPRPMTPPRASSASHEGSSTAGAMVGPSVHLQKAREYMKMQRALSSMSGGGLSSASPRPTSPYRAAVLPATSSSNKFQQMLADSRKLTSPQGREDFDGASESSIASRRLAPAKTATLAKAEAVMRSSQARRQQANIDSARSNPNANPAFAVTRSDLIRGGESPVFAHATPTSQHPTDE